MRGPSSLAAGTLLATGVLGASAGTRAQCCKALSELPGLEDKVYYPNNAAYDERMGTYWSLSAALEPWCMVLPDTPLEVSLVITTISLNHCPFGIRGGGHGTHALSNTLEEGVTIDMGHFNATTYNAETKIASVGPGAHWGEVYDALTPHGVTVAGGRAGSVGVGGFLSGGGNSFHSGSHGFACDQIQNVEIVLSSGLIVNANEEENRDLWVALKGGSGNFGLITRFDLYAIEFENPDNHIWGGIVGYPINKTDAVVNAFVNFTNNVVNDVHSSTILSWGYNPASGGFSIRGVFDNDANVATPPAFDEFLSIDGITSNSLRHGTMSNITAELIRPTHTYTIWFTGTYKNDARIVKFIADKHAEMILKIESIIGADSGLFTSCQVQPMTEPMIAQAKGNNVMGLEERIVDGPGLMFLNYFGVESKENEAIALPYVQGFYEAVEEYATSLDANWNWHYLNYAYRTQDPIAAYGSAAVAKVKAASRKYDPCGVFQKLRQSGFKIPF